MEYKCNPHESFANFMAAHSINENIAIALSGGADSMALTLIANQWAKENGKKIIAITVDHAIRAESANEAEQVAKWLSDKNIEHHILTWKDGNKTSNIQANARDARYKLMTDFCIGKKINCLMVAHNKEDQAETILLRLMRGSGVDGLSSMQEKTKVNNINIYRPFLNLSKADLRIFLKQINQQWIEDPSNNNDKFARVNIRKFLSLAEDSSLLTERLVSTAQNMARSKSYIDSKIAEDTKHVCKIMQEGYATIDIEKLQNLHIEAQYKILSNLIKKIGGQYYKPRFEKLISLHSNIINGVESTLGGCKIHPSKKKSQPNQFIISRELSRIAVSADINPNETIIWDDRFYCNLKDIDIKNLKVEALGKEGFAYICRLKPDLKKIKLPKQIIYSLPCLKSLENILFAPHIEYCSDNDIKDRFTAKFIF